MTTLEVYYSIWLTDDYNNTMADSARSKRPAKEDVGASKKKGKVAPKKVPALRYACF